MRRFFGLVFVLGVALCMQSCDGKTELLEVDKIKGKDHFIAEFSLMIDGMSYPGAIKGERIEVEIPESVDLKQASVQYALSEGATINPDPEAVKDWGKEWRFVVTSKSQERRVYLYTYRFAEDEGSVHLATQQEVDDFVKSGIKDIKGNLIIGTPAGEEIKNLRGLENLRRVRRALVLNASYKGEDLAGLEKLDTLGSFKMGTPADVFGDSTVKTVSFPALRCVTGDFFVNCQLVENISIPKVERIGGDLYLGSNELTNFGATALKEVVGNCEVRGSVTGNWRNPLLQSFSKAETITFEALERVGGKLDISLFPRVDGFNFPALKVVEGKISVKLLSSLVELTFPELISTGGFEIYLTALITKLQRVNFPRLKTCNGDFKVAERELTTLHTPMLMGINGSLELVELKTEGIDFSALRDVKLIEVKMLPELKNFSCFEPLFTNEVIKDKSQWSISDCGYNPTFDNMKKGLYTKELYQKYKDEHPDYKD